MEHEHRTMREHKGDQMDSERVTRTTLPQVTVGMPLSLLKWVNEQAKAAGMSRSGLIVQMIEQERLAAVLDSDATDEELAAVS
jgi:hypothetical protein